MGKTYKQNNKYSYKENRDSKPFKKGKKNNVQKEKWKGEDYNPDPYIDIQKWK